MTEAMARVGRRADCARYYKEEMAAAGFINVVEKKYVWPNNTWPKDEKLKEIGIVSLLPQ